MVVIGGPWIGEFGGELENWHAWLRHLKNTKYINNYFVAISFPGRSVLYEFADEFWDLPYSFVRHVENRRFFTRWASIVDANTDKVVQYSHPIIVDLLREIKEKVYSRFGNDVVFIQPYIGEDYSTYSGSNYEYDFKLIRTDKKTTLKKLVSIFPRNRLNEPWRNWSYDNWRKLIYYLLSNGFSVVSMGMDYDSFTFNINHENFINAINEDLNTQVSYLQDSLVAVTSICGAIRFAAFVGCPTITFGNMEYVEAVEVHEKKSLYSNPFNTPLYILGKNGSWDYSSEEVFNFIKRYI